MKSLNLGSIAFNVHHLKINELDLIIKFPSGLISFPCDFLHPNAVDYKIKNTGLLATF